MARKYAFPEKWRPAQPIMSDDPRLEAAKELKDESVTGPKLHPTLSNKFQKLKFEVGPEENNKRILTVQVQNIAGRDVFESIPLFVEGDGIGTTFTFSSEGVGDVVTYPEDEEADIITDSSGKAVIGVTCTEAETGQFNFMTRTNFVSFQVVELEFSGQD